MSGLTRRGVLGAGLSLSALGLAGNPLARAAAASAPDDYKALVCVFLTGGMDGHDTLIPADGRPYDDWAKLRGPLMEGYRRAGRPRTPDTLHALGPDAAGMTVGLAPEFGGVAEAYRRGEAAVVANIGPLQGPVTPSQLKGRSVPLPPKLFSHSNQRAYWRTLREGPGLETGWGGRLADAAAADDPFARINAARDEGFLTGPDGLGVTVAAFESFLPFGFTDKLWGSEDLAALFHEHLASASESAGILERDFARAQGESVEVQKRLADMLASTKNGEEVAAGKPRSSLAYRLAVVAKMIALRKETGLKRQVFYVELGGFDTHSEQAERLPPLQRQVDDALVRFTDWARSAGVLDKVTVFTASDFGRTLVPNRSGTDHGWGGHQIVMGGAVRGGRVYGALPPMALGHDLDAGRGRLIPNLAVEQVGAPLARWFGVPEARMADVFPYAGRFDTKAVPLFG